MQSIDTHKKSYFIRNEAYPLICHGSEYQNTPCGWHPPNPVPKGYPTEHGKGVNSERRNWRKREAERWILTALCCWVAMKLLLREEGLLLVVPLSTKLSCKKAMVAHRKKSHKRQTKISVPVPLEAITGRSNKTSIYC